MQQWWVDYKCVEQQWAGWNPESATPLSSSCHPAPFAPFATLTHMGGVLLLGEDDTDEQI